MLYKVCTHFLLPHIQDGSNEKMYSSTKVYTGTYRTPESGVLNRCMLVRKYIGTCKLYQTGGIFDILANVTFCYADAHIVRNNNDTSSDLTPSDTSSFLNDCINPRPLLAPFMFD